MATVLQHVFDQNLSDLRNGSQLEEYGRFQQHLVLLEDDLRLAKFAHAIGVTTPSDVVIDVGAGTGVLSLMALQHGYEHAIMIEPSRKMCKYIEHLLALNGYEGRATIVNSTLEAVDFDALPKRVGLVVTETISTLIAGFGSWDLIPKLAARLDDQGRMIPESGSVRGYLCKKPQSYRHEGNGGLSFLNRIGIKTDLFQQSFRSYGKVFDKRMAQPHGAEIFDLVQFDVKSDPAMHLLEAEVRAHETAEYCGITTYFEIYLNREQKIAFWSLDPRLSAWYPYYIPFAEPVKLEADERLPIKLVLHAIDAPYTYAFQFISGGRELTRILYW
jgi:hypothetical protein